MNKNQALHTLKRLVPMGGPVIFLAIFFSDLGLSTDQQKFLAIFSFVIYNWIFATLPLYVTGFIGVCLTVLLGIETPSVALASYANPIIFLFLSGFLFAHSMHEIGLDRRLSLQILSNRTVSSSFSRLLLSLYALCAFLSMWVSNTATTAMMLPIVLGTIRNLGLKDKKTISLILIGLAYSASIGGIATPIGSPPNIIAIGMLKEIADVDLNFALWTLIAFPISVLALITLFLFIRNKMPVQNFGFDTEFIQNEKEKLGPLTHAEKHLMVFFACLLFFWFMPGILSTFIGESFPIFVELEKRLEPGIIGLLFSSLLFIFPLKKPQKLLKPENINSVDWGSLLLFGSGLALGKSLFNSGLAQVLGDLLVQSISDSSFFIYLLGVSFLTKFFTETTSNTATANILLPIIIATSVALGYSPLLPAMLVAASSSLTFMLPVATPPNAIVYGTGKVNTSDMIRFGFTLNIIFGVLMAVVFFLVSYLV